MTSFVLTLIGNADSRPLETAHIEQVFQRLELSAKVDWLAEGEACDLYFDSQYSTIVITEITQDALAGSSIDVACTPAEGRRKKMLISDMDSTVINQECINELAGAMGLGEQIGAITESVIRGDISFSEALSKRLRLMAGMEEKLLQTVYEQRISLKTGARTLVQTMRHHGAFCILVSGGFTFFTRRIADALGFHDHQGNELIFSDGKLTGEAQSPILGRTAKQDSLMALCAEKNIAPSEVLAVGDGANDIKMIQTAGLGVAFHDSGSLREVANAHIGYGDLTALLFIQGYRKSEFILT
jgi:phosphoserine phosphatase